jgi:hypothetical protein
MVMNDDKARIWMDKAVANLKILSRSGYSTEDTEENHENVIKIASNPEKISSIFRCLLAPLRMSGMN